MLVFRASTQEVSNSSLSCGKPSMFAAQAQNSTWLAISPYILHMHLCQHQHATNACTFHNCVSQLVSCCYIAIQVPAMTGLLLDSSANTSKYACT